MKRNSFIQLAIGVLCAAALAGCTTPSSVAGCMPYANQGEQATSAVSVLSPDLAGMIGVRDFSTGRTPTGFASVQTTVQNCTDYDVSVLMRTRFTGDRGESEPSSAWRAMILAPHAQRTYSESAVSANTRKLAIDIHDAQRAQQTFVPGEAYTQ